jgi:DNA (cytosine-5)-methyltransferase 1
MMPSAVTLLPTVAAHDSGNTPEQHLAKKPGRIQVTSLQITVDHLLPTCTVQDGANTGGPSQFERNTLPLNTQRLVLPHLDPTTPVEEYEKLWYSLTDHSPSWVTDERPGIPSVDYWPAIQRWESVMGRVSPPPSIPDGRGGKFRLNAALTEWMMGLPDGWVTDPAIGISRNEQLKACGNGVVPQQAMAALRDMLAAFQTAEVAA